ncbi:hypothetical protein Syun_000385 [Stephania yunnanensis]|uniref:Uncharacterized protein n=1 Tax=Stephania yunnanensis TaxID=152371 RepID=A0AAP0LD00_9MAGN
MLQTVRCDVWDRSRDYSSSGETRSEASAPGTQRQSCRGHKSAYHFGVSRLGNLGDGAGSQLLVHIWSSIRSRSLSFSLLLSDYQPC